MGGDGRHFQAAAEQGFPVLLHLVGEGRHVLGIGEVQVVVEAEGAALHLLGPQGTDHIFIFQQAGMGGAVGIHQACLLYTSRCV